MIDDQTAEIMLTSLSRGSKAVISSDAPPLFFFFIANPTQIDACCVRLWLHLNLQTCTGGQVLQPTWRLSRLRSRFLCSLLLLGVVLQSSPQLAGKETSCNY